MLVHEPSVVSVKHHHLLKRLLAYSHDDHAHRLMRGLDDSLDRFLLVRDFPVCEDQQHVVRLLLALPCMHDRLPDDRREVGRPIQLRRGDGAAVGRQKSVDSWHLGCLGLTVEREAVRRLRLPVDDPSEAVHCDLPVVVVLHQDLSHPDHRLLVLVQRPVRMDVVQGVGVVRVSVGHGEVDGDRDCELAAVGDVVVQRGVPDDMHPVYCDRPWLLGAPSRAIVER
mmetsp:Transcript_2970/g.7151  ORF Transcript_2970/g.7151 Transcript_2970/m.7151 type:complete len:225 (+) Transcript_2970:576-1250(+)